MVALITGASTGIGAEFARQFAARGHGLVVVARSEDKLNALAQQLRAAHGVDVTVIAMDLSVPTAAGDLWQRTNSLGLEITILVNNAGFGTHRDVADAVLERDQRLAAALVHHLHVLDDLGQEVLGRGRVVRHDEGEVADVPDGSPPAHRGGADPREVVRGGARRNGGHVRVVDRVG